MKPKYHVNKYLLIFTDTIVIIPETENHENTINLFVPTKLFNFLPAVERYLENISTKN